MHFFRDSACMSQVTIRRVEEAWVAKAKAEAAERGVSMNQVLVDALQRGLGVNGHAKTNGLEKFSGDSAHLFDEAFDAAMEDCSRIDWEEWK